MKGSDVAVGAKKALVVSDDDRLGRAITLILDSCLDADVTELALGSRQPEKSATEDADLELIVLALSSAHSEPIVVLSRALLSRWIGQVPILIISERDLPSNLGEQIYHMDFFDPHKLCERVQEILAEHPEKPEPDRASN